MGGINNEIIKNRSSVIVIPTDWILPDARYWVNNGEMNEFFPYQRLYADEKKEKKLRQLDFIKAVEDIAAARLVYEPSGGG